MRDSVKNSLLWFRALKRYEPLCSSVVYHFNPRNTFSVNRDAFEGYHIAAGHSECNCSVEKVRKQKQKNPNINTHNRNVSLNSQHRGFSSGHIRRIK